MAKYITELLSAANDNPTLLGTPAYKDNYAIREVLSYAFDKNNKMALPAGRPPFKEDTAPLGMTPANFYQVVKKFYVFKRKDLPKLKLESIFIQTLEGVHPTEAAVLVAIKDQNLDALYPNITTSLVVSCGYVSADNAKEAVEPAPKSEEPVAVQEQPNEPVGKRLELTVNDSTTIEDQPGAAPVGDKAPSKAPAKTRTRKAAK